jgi:WD40 repeat protein
MITTLKPDSVEVYCVTVSPDGKTLACRSNDGNINLWSLATLKHTRTLRADPHAVYSLAFSSDAQTLVSGGWDATVKVWDVATGRNMATLGRHTGHVWMVALSPDGKTLASCGGGLDKPGEIHLWDLPTRKHVRALEAHTLGWVWCLAFTPDGKRLASAGWDRNIRLWQLHSGESDSTPRAHTGNVTSLAFSPDGTTLASCSALQKDLGRITLWRVVNLRGTGR